ncbi:MAG: hypothetical protein KAR56_03060 [Thermoplasmata archaeon]|nr:hypothetical protein [Thermoplasmata archaeon]
MIIDDEFGNNMSETNPKSTNQSFNPVKCFISHRCKEYDNAKWKPAFEIFLIEQGIQPVYGCDLDITAHGLIDEDIEEAIKMSEMYIAVITESWKDISDTVGWPRKEWDLWKSLHSDNEARKRCIGLLLNVNRDTVDFLGYLRSYPLKNTGMASLQIKELFADYKTDKNTYKTITTKLNKMVEEINIGRIE